MNYMTLTEFYDYMIEQNLVDYNNDWYFHTVLGRQSILLQCKSITNRVKKHSGRKVRARYTGNKCIDRITNSAVDFAANEDRWENAKEQFTNTFRLDDIRGEDFSKLPELQPQDYSMKTAKQLVNDSKHF